MPRKENPGVPDDLTSTNDEDPVAYVHPADQLGREHTIAAAQQIQHLLRYLAEASRPPTAERAYPEPEVTMAVALALREGMRSASQLFDLLYQRLDRYASDPRLHDAERGPGGGARHVEDSAAALANAADDCDRLVEELDAAVTAGSHAGISAGQ
jgi:hypothetical protein